MRNKINYRAINSIREITRCTILTAGEEHNLSDADVDFINARLQSALTTLLGVARRVQPVQGDRKLQVVLENLLGSVEHEQD